MSTMISRPLQALSLILVALLAFTAIDIDPADAATRKQRRIERRLHNRSRKARARRPLKLHWRLNRVARKHSLRMARRNDLHHNPRLASQVSTLSWRRLGENVGVARSKGSGTLRAIHRAFMASRPHRRNILHRRFRRMGVGVAKGAGKVWVTVIFMG